LSLNLRQKIVNAGLKAKAKDINPEAKAMASWPQGQDLTSRTTSLKNNKIVSLLSNECTHLEFWTV